MKNLEDIEKEYKGYKAKTTFVKSPEEFQTFIEVLLGDIEESEEISKREIKDNKRWKFEVKIKNYFLVLINQREVEAYDEDTNILKEMTSLDEDFKKYYEKMLSLVTETNFKELLRLADFVSEYYTSHSEFLDKKREMLELELRGIHMFAPTDGYNKVAFGKFITRKLDETERKAKMGKQYIKKG